MSPGDHVYRILALAVDAEFYRGRYADVREAGEDPVAHYASVGWRERRDPAPWFSTNEHLRRHPELEREGTNPLYHFLVRGLLAGETTLAGELGEDATREAVEAYFDQAYYLANNPDVAAAGVDPFEHYLLSGWREGRDPSPVFRTNQYIKANPDVARAGINPFVHYAAHGAKEGRDPAPFSTIIAKARSDIEREFDERYYLRMYDDVSVQDVTPLDHYLHTGWREGKNPNAEFSSAEYLELYPDVAEQGVNPFVHYVTVGRDEGRAPRYSIDFRSRMLTRSVSLEDRIANIRFQFGGIRVAGADDLLRLLEPRMRAEDPIVFSVSHDDYTQNIGGVQLCVRREARALRDAGFRHVHLYPAVPLPCNELEREEYAVGVIVDGVSLGLYSSTALAGALARLGGTRPTAERVFVVHSFLGHNAYVIAEILQAAGVARGYVWTHDYGTVCSGWNLLRDDVAFCGAPPADSSACSICMYGATRRAQAGQADFFFEKFETTVVAPSESTLAFWRKASGRQPESVKVLPHCELVFRAVDERASRRTSGPLRIAYLGFPAFHKGWPVFSGLAEKFASDDRYEFHHLGSGQDPRLPVIFTPVMTSADDAQAMARAVEEREIDVGLIWSLCPETFCFTAHEALAGGAAIVTGRDSGNVVGLASQREGRGTGLVVDDVGILQRMLSAGALDGMRRGARAVELADLRYGNVTADLIIGRQRERSLL